MVNQTLQDPNLEHLKIGKLFPQKSQAADLLSWSMKSTLAPLLKPFLKV